MDALNNLLHSQAFWAALLALVNVVLYYFVPTFPKEIWAAVDALAVIVFGFFATRQTVRVTRAQRAVQAATVDPDA